MKPKPPVQLWDVMIWREILPGQQQSRPGLRSSHLLRTFPSPNTESCPHICTYRRQGCRTWPGSCWCSSRWWSCRSRSTPAPGRWWRCSRWPPAPPGRTCPANYQDVGDKCHGRNVQICCIQLKSRLDRLVMFVTNWPENKCQLVSRVLVNFRQCYWPAWMGEGKQE